MTTDQLNKLLEGSDSLHVLKEVAPILSYSQRQLLLKQIVKSSDLTTAEGLLKTAFWCELDELDKSKIANLLIHSDLAMDLLYQPHLHRKFSEVQMDKLVEQTISKLKDFSFFEYVPNRFSECAKTLITKKMAGYPDQSYKYFYRMGAHLTPAQRQTILVALAKDPYWSHHAVRGLKLTEEEKELFSE